MQLLTKLDYGMLDDVAMSHCLFHEYLSSSVGQGCVGIGGIEHESTWLIRRSDLWDPRWITTVALQWDGTIFPRRQAPPRGLLSQEVDTTARYIR